MRFRRVEIKRQEQGDLARFDPRIRVARSFSAGISAGHFYDDRPDLGDGSHGRVVTLDNYLALFSGLLVARRDPLGVITWGRPRSSGDFSRAEKAREFNTPWVPGRFPDTLSCIYERFPSGPVSS